MPHKHQRSKSKDDPSYHDLPPSKGSRPQPHDENHPNNFKAANLRKRKNNVSHKNTDTPKAFLRLTSNYRSPRSGLDDGLNPRKRRKIAPSSSDVAPSLDPYPLPALVIQPHEPLSTFNARVDLALPISGVAKKSNGGKEFGGERKTKTEKRMQKMQNEWREEAQRRKEKRDADADEATVDEDGIDDMLRVAKEGCKKKGGKRNRMDDEEDIWAQVKTKRPEDLANIKATGRPRGGELVGLHDVVLAPPKFSKVPRLRENFGVRPGMEGLKKQAEMTEARQIVIENYRQMMRNKRGEAG